MNQIKVKKSEVLQKIGEYNSKVFAVKSGLLRSYTIDSKGKEHIFMFAPEGWVIADSTPPESQTSLYIDAIEDSVLMIKNKDIDGESRNAKPLINRLLVLQKRVIMLMGSSAIERYEHFLDTYPDIVQRVPQKMIASYLGMTPEALSKIKSDRIREI